MDLTKEYELEEKAVFNVLLNTSLLPLPSANNRLGDEYHYFINTLGMELIVHPQCNQQCEYCYIYKYGKDLYPNYVTDEEMLHNTDLIFDYVFNQRRNYFYEIELFGGDLFSSEIYFKLLDIYEKYLKKIKEECYQIFKTQTTFCCPSNLSWVVEHPHLINKFRKYYKHFADEYNVFLSLSWSTDGYYAMSTREKKTLTDEYFNKIFEFCKEFGCGYHPMIAPENVETWCENYDWWMEKYKQYDLTAPGYFQPYLLHVRNNNWTSELTEHFCKFLRHLMDWRLKMCDNDIRKLTCHLLRGNNDDDILPASKGCDPLILNDKCGPLFKINEGMSCSGQTLVHFNTTNLSIVTCHRTSYPQFVPIYFITDEKKEHIIDFKPNNIGAYINWRFHKVENYPVCSKCDYCKICLKVCLGAQFEHSGELYMPIDSLCKFYKTFYEYLYDLYKEYGILTQAKEFEWFMESDGDWSWVKDQMRKDGIL